MHSVYMHIIYIWIDAIEQIWQLSSSASLAKLLVESKTATLSSLNKACRWCRWCQVAKDGWMVNFEWSFGNDLAWIAWNNPDRLCFVYSFLYNAVNSPQYWWSKMDMPWAQAGFYSKISRCVSWGAGKFYLTTCTGYITRKQGFKLTSQLVFSAETNNCSSSGF